MAEQADELKKLVGIATDLDLSPELRTRATKQMGRMSTHEALRALLDLAANDKLTRTEREIALKYARDSIRASH